MARIRSIKPEFWSSPTLARVSREARLTFVGLWNLADDTGRCEALPRTLLGALYPFDDDVTESELTEWVDQLATVGLLRLYESRGRRYLFVTGWKEHQRIDNPSKARCPDPDDDDSHEITSLTCGYGDSSETLARVSREASDRSVGASERRSVGDGAADKPPPASDLTADSFEDFWRRYPRHAKNGKPGGGGDRKPTQRRWRNLTQAQRDAALRAVDHYRAWCESPDGAYPKHAETWLNAESWEQWQEPADHGQQFDYTDPTAPPRDVRPDGSRRGAI